MEISTCWRSFAKRHAFCISITQIGRGCVCSGRHPPRSWGLNRLAGWKSAVGKYEFARGVTSGFPYIDYYTALATVRGAVVFKGQAVAFAVEPEGRRRVLDSLP